MEESRVSRRSFLDWFLGTAAGALLVALVYPVVRFLDPPETAEASASEVEAGPVNDPAFVDRGFKVVSFGADPVIVVRARDNDFRAFAATCTHLSCIVEYRKDKELIWCNCHNGAYDLGGRNVAGPPPKPLRPYAVNLMAAGPGQPESIVISKG